jgi:hypothetical protein
MYREPVIARNEATKKKEHQNLNYLILFLLLLESQSLIPKFIMNYTISPPNTPSYLLEILQLPVTVTNCPENRKIIPYKLSIFPKTK